MNRIADCTFIVPSVTAAIIWITILRIASPLGSRCNRQAERQDRSSQYRKFQCVSVRHCSNLLRIHLGLGIDPQPALRCGRCLASVVPFQFVSRKASEFAALSANRADPDENVTRILATEVEENGEVV